MLEENSTVKEEEILSPEELEDALANVSDEDIDVSAQIADYDKYVVLSKRDVANFVRLTEPLTKAAIDQYGKSIYVHCNDNCSSVKFSFFNNPYFVTTEIANRSGKSVRDFSIEVVTLRKLLCSGLTSLTFVENSEGEVSIVTGQCQVPVETINLYASAYDKEQSDTTDTIDKELAVYTFKTIGTILALSDRAFEKVAVVRNNTISFNTGVFSSVSKSPFSGDASFIVFKQVSDLIATLASFAKSDIRFGLDGRIMTITADSYYFSLPVITGEKVNEFVSTAAEIALKFDAQMTLVNDNLQSLLTLFKQLSYIEENVTLSFTDKSLIFTAKDSKTEREYPYEFAITEGRPDTHEQMKAKIAVLQIFLALVGEDIKYSYTNAGLGIENPYGRYLLKRS